MADGEGGLKIPGDAIAKNVNLGVFRGERDDGTRLAMIRVTDQDTGEITWVPMPSKAARWLAYKLLLQAEEIDADGDA